MNFSEIKDENVLEILSNMVFIKKHASKASKNTNLYKYIYMIPKEDINKWNILNNKLDFIQSEIQKYFTVTKFEPVTNFQLNSIIIEFSEKNT